ncbi:MAG: Pvc16 family protein [Candidatus Promineifilaceae bacterium]|nr:Pvc16 family protein [Candidatus Promineifilaceae bacterium]
MIADLDETIRQMLIGEIPIRNGEVDVKFEQPKREWSAKLTKPTINFFLYDVRENVELRKTGWRQMEPPNGNGRHDVTAKKRMPIRVDCFYMLTTWAAEPEDEHRLMSRVLLALYRHPILPDSYLAGSMPQQPLPLRAWIARHDRLTNPAEVWSALDNEMRPSVSYYVTLTLDPWSIVTGPPVRTFTMRTGQTDTLPKRQEFAEGGLSAEMVNIGGTVFEKDEPRGGLQVAIKGTGFMDTTDDEGRFELGSILPGEYTLVVWPDKGKPKEKKVTVPGKLNEYDLTI